jgi:hypothetical protein
VGKVTQAKRTLEASFTEMRELEGAIEKRKEDMEGQAEEKKDFQKSRMGWLRFEPATLDEKQDMVSSNSKYGRIICRCEKVTEAEILDAIESGVKAGKLKPRPIRNLDNLYEWLRLHQLFGQDC